jgi:hypothetical protein
MAELEHTTVSIRFAGKDLDPVRLSELLRFTRTVTTQSIVRSRKNGTVIWSISYEGNEKLSVVEKIEALLAMFTKEKSAWAQARENVKADIFCGLFLDGWNQGFGLTPELMREISDRNLEIGFDVYAPTDFWYGSAVEDS